MEYCDVAKEFYKRYYPEFKVSTDTYCKEIFIELKNAFLIRVEFKDLNKNSISVNVVIFNKNEFYLKEYWSNVYKTISKTASIDEIFEIIDKEIEEAKEAKNEVQ